MSIEYSGFNDEAGDVLRMAGQLAQDDGQEFISSLYILRALLKHKRNQACRVLVQMGHTEQTILPALVVSTTDTPETATSLMPWPKKVIDLAVQTAREWKDVRAGTEHLLMGLLAEGDCLAAIKLKGLLVTAERAKVIIFELRKNPTPTASPAATDQEFRENLWHILEDLQATFENMGAILKDLAASLEPKQ